MRESISFSRLNWSSRLRCQNQLEPISQEKVDPISSRLKKALGAQRNNALQSWLGEPELTKVHDQRCMQQWSSDELQYCTAPRHRYQTTLWNPCSRDGIRAGKRAFAYSAKLSMRYRGCVDAVSPTNEDLELSLRQRLVVKHMQQWSAVGGYLQSPWMLSFSSPHRCHRSMKGNGLSWRSHHVRSALQQLQ